MDGNQDLSREVIKKEAEVVSKMIDDETWYEGERRNMEVAKDDPVVKDKVCDILRDHGLKIYNEIKTRLTGDV